MSNNLSPSHREIVVAIPLLHYFFEESQTIAAVPRSGPNQKNPRVRKNFVRNSGAGNGCANFVDTWKKCPLSAGKTHVHKIPPFGGGVFWVFGGGGVPILFLWARGFF